METKECFEENKKVFIHDDSELINEYLNSLNDIELKALKIAKEHLKTSFNIRKCNGFQEYIKTKKNNT